MTMSSRVATMSCIVLLLCAGALATGASAEGDVAFLLLKQSTSTVIARYIEGFVSNFCMPDLEFWTKLLRSRKPSGTTSDVQKGLKWDDRASCKDMHWCFIPKIALHTCRDR